MEEAVLARESNKIQVKKERDNNNPKMWNEFQGLEDMWTGNFLLFLGNVYIYIKFSIGVSCIWSYLKIYIK